VLLAALLVTRNLASAKQRFESAADGRDVDTRIDDLVAIDLDIELRLLESQVRVRIDEAGILPDLPHHRIHIALEILIGAGGLNHIFDVLRAAALAERGRIDAERHYARYLSKLRLQGSDDLLLRAASFVPGYETRKGDEIRDLRKARHDEITRDLGNVDVELLDLFRVALREFERRTLRRLTDDQQCAAILERRELRPQQGEQADAGKRHSGGDRDDQPAPD